MPNKIEYLIPDCRLIAECHRVGESSHHLPGFVRKSVVFPDWNHQIPIETNYLHGRIVMSANSEDKSQYIKQGTGAADAKATGAALKRQAEERQTWRQKTGAAEAQAGCRFSLHPGGSGLKPASIARMH
jgi:hypothetical protein